MQDVLFCIIFLISFSWSENQPDRRSVSSLQSTLHLIIFLGFESLTAEYNVSRLLSNYSFLDTIFLKRQSVHGTVVIKNSTPKI